MRLGSAVSPGKGGVKTDRPLPLPQLYATYRFTFDHVYDQDSRQEEVYETSARSAVHCTLQGYNAAIIAYGQVCHQALPLPPGCFQMEDGLVEPSLCR